MPRRAGGYDHDMAEVRDNEQPAGEGMPAGEGFHEETPQEFAEQPDRDFTKVPTPGEDAETPDEDAETPNEDGR